VADLLWRRLKDVKVPAGPGMAWTPALDFVAPKRLYRLEVQPGGKWKLKDQAAECTADGYGRDVARGASTPVVADAPIGALIAKVGGSTADNTGQLFAVGRYCVFQVEDAKAGPLYLGANDVALLMTAVDGQLTVEVSIAL
jgi:hypothetical protein